MIVVPWASGGSESATEKRERLFFQVFDGLHEQRLGDGDGGASSGCLSDEFHLTGQYEFGELADAFAALHGAVQVGCAVAFATLAGAGDVEVFCLDLGGLHAAAIVLNDDG